MPGPTFDELLAKLRALDVKLRRLEDRVSVIETNSISYENRLQDLEELDDDNG